MHPEESKPFLIGPATLVNGSSYPSAAGVRIDRAMSTCPDNGPATFMVGGAATFGAGSLQREVSFNGGATWFADGAAITAATLLAVTFARSGLYRWTVAGANITASALYVG